MSKERVIQTFIDLVQIDSPTGYEEEMSREVSSRLEEMGVNTSIDNLGNVFARVEGDNNKEPLLLNAHLDTVEPGRGIRPTINQDGYIRSSGDTILGADNKSAVAAILELITRIKETNSSDHHPLELIFTVSEESGNHGAHGFDYRQLEARRGFIFDASDREFGSLIISSPFYNRFDCTLEGVPAHASRPELAQNPLPVFAQGITQLNFGRQEDGSLVNIGIVQVGQVVNTIPGEVSFSGEVRSMVEADLEKHSQKIVDTYQRLALENLLSFTHSVVRENDGYEIAEDDPFLLETMQKLISMKIEPNLVRSWGCYEANIFHSKGLKMINLADGSKASHTVDETIHKDDLIRLVDLAYKLII